MIDHERAVARMGLKIRVDRFRKAQSDKSFVHAREAWVWAHFHNLKLPEDVLECFAKNIKEQCEGYQDDRVTLAAKSAELDQKRFFVGFVASHNSVTDGVNAWIDILNNPEEYRKLRMEYFRQEYIASYPTPEMGEKSCRRFAEGSDFDKEFIDKVAFQPKDIHSMNTESVRKAYYRAKNE